MNCSSLSERREINPSQVSGAAPSLLQSVRRVRSSVSAVRPSRPFVPSVRLRPSIRPSSPYVTDEFLVALTAPVSLIKTPPSPQTKRRRRSRSDPTTAQRRAMRWPDTLDDGKDGRSDCSEVPTGERASGRANVWTSGPARGRAGGRDGRTGCRGQPARIYYHSYSRSSAINCRKALVEECFLSSRQLLSFNVPLVLGHRYRLL